MSACRLSVLLSVSLSICLYVCVCVYMCVFFLVCPIHEDTSLIMFDRRLSLIRCCESKPITPRYVETKKPSTIITTTPDFYTCHSIVPYRRHTLLLDF